MLLDLCAFGCVATTAELKAIAEWDEFIALLHWRSDVVYVHRGLWACAHLSPLELQAIACGARLDCVTALRLAGASFDPPADELTEVHLRFARGAARPSARRHTQNALDALPDIVAHWNVPAFTGPTTLTPRDVLPRRSRFGAKPPPDRIRMPLHDATLQAMRCVPAESLPELLHACVAGSLLTTGELAMLAMRLPAARQPAVARALRSLH